MGLLISFKHGLFDTHRRCGELNAQHPLGDAFFDYDQSALRDDARAALQKDADWLRRWPSVRVAVQGQCDERGSAEYNLALGDKRAHAVETYLRNPRCARTIPRRAGLRTGGGTS
jgi:outer membrane protein OmpA-like peptidoglycan-associated protein